MKEIWLENAREGNLKDMKEINQRLRSKGLQQEMKNFKDSEERNALMWATVKGRLDICQFLVREDLVDVNAKNEWGWNALHFAASFNQPEIARLLLEETSIDVNDQTNIGSTALHIVAQWNYPGVTRILLKFNPRNLKNDRGETALDVARSHKKECIIQLLRTHYNT